MWFQNWLVCSLKRLCLQFLTGSAIALGGASAIAQKPERFVTVGTDKVGNPILLDTQEIRGTTFKLISAYGNGISEATFKGECGESRIFLTKIGIYSSSGRTLMEDKKSEEVPFKAESSIGKSMTFVCRRIGQDCAKTGKLYAKELI